MRHRAMTLEWLRLIGDVGWEAPTSELTWCTTMHDDVNMKIVVNEEIAKRAGSKEGFKVLGTIVTFDNNYDVELEHRIQKAVISFHKNKDLLLCSSVPLGKRLQVFRATVEASLVWCAGSWNLTLEQYQRLRGAQLRRVRRMLRLKRNKGETMSELIIRSNHTLKQRLRDIGTCYESWDQRVVQLRLDWGGHIARMGRFDPFRLTFRVFTHWNYAFIMNTISDNNGG